MTWPRPIPLIGDATSSAERAGEPGAWAFEEVQRTSIYDIIKSRRDVRRFRPDPLSEELLQRVLEAAHNAPSVGHSQPWRFVVVSEPATRERAAWIADRERIEQARLLEPDAQRHLLDLQLEGIREAPLGIVVCCDRRVPGPGVLGRATFDDADVWSCACAIENLWLAARAEGLGMGWVTLFPPDELGALIGLPDGVVTLGWLCIGWPDERPPLPGLERAGWSKRQPLSDVVMYERWTGESAAPISRLRSPSQVAVVSARDGSDTLLTPPGSLGVLDRALDRIIAMGRHDVRRATLVLVAGDHLVADLGVTAYGRNVTADVLAAAQAGESIGVVTARAAGFDCEVIDAGSSTGNLLDTDALHLERVHELIGEGTIVGRRVGACGLVVLGEIGMGNTTVAAALAAFLLDRPSEMVVGLGAGSDATMLERKRFVVDGALSRSQRKHGASLADPIVTLASLGGPEFAFLVGVVLGAVEERQAVVLDGFATSVAALVAAQMEPAVTSFLIAGQRSREKSHADLLTRLGLEPLLDLRIRSGEGVGAILATQMVLTALRSRAETAQVTPFSVTVV